MAARTHLGLQLSCTSLCICVPLPHDSALLIKGSKETLKVLWQHSHSAAQHGVRHSMVKESLAQFTADAMVASCAAMLYPERHHTQHGADIRSCHHATGTLECICVDVDAGTPLTLSV